MRKGSVDKDVKVERREEPGLSVAVKVSSRQNIRGGLEKEAVGEKAAEDDANNATAKQSKSKKERKAKKKKKHSTSSSSSGGEESDDDNDRAKSKKKATAGVTTRINIFAGAPGAPNVNVQGGLPAPGALAAPGYVSTMNQPMPMIQQVQTGSQKHLPAYALAQMPIPIHAPAMGMQMAMPDARLAMMPMPDAQLPMIEHVPMQQPASKRSSKKAKSKSASAETAQAAAIIPAGAAGLLSGPEGQDVLVIPMPPGMKLPPFGNLNDMYAHSASSQTKKKKKASQPSVDTAVAAGVCGSASGGVATGAAGRTSGGVAAGGGSGSVPRLASGRGVATGAAGGTSGGVAAGGGSGSVPRLASGGAVASGAVGAPHQNIPREEQGGVKAGEIIAAEMGERDVKKAGSAVPEGLGAADATGKKGAGRENDEGDVQRSFTDDVVVPILERGPKRDAAEEKSAVSSEEDSNLMMMIIFAAVIGIIVIVVIVFVVLSSSGSKSEPSSSASVNEVPATGKPFHDEGEHKIHRVVRRHPSPLRNYMRVFRRFKHPVEAYWNIK